VDEVASLHLQLRKERAALGGVAGCFLRFQRKSREGVAMCLEVSNSSSRYRSPREGGWLKVMLAACWGVWVDLVGFEVFFLCGFGRFSVYRAFFYLAGYY